MCSVLGGILFDTPGNRQFEELLKRSAARGRDSTGVVTMDASGTLAAQRWPGPASDMAYHVSGMSPVVAIANCRAEPTTEWVQHKRLDDVQPFTAGGWSVAHNGTIANDAELRDRFGLPAPATPIDSAVLPALFARHGRGLYAVREALAEVVGSYAIVATDSTRPGNLFFAANYRPLYLARHLATGSVFVVSDKAFVSNEPMAGFGHWQIEAVQPYSCGVVSLSKNGRGCTVQTIDMRPPMNATALVVCSGGLDSTVAAQALEHAGHAVTLLHFQYGCRASEAEARAIEAIAARKGWPVITVPLGDLFTHVIAGSPLTSAKAAPVANGEAGAEFAHEWVPARNLVMLSIATAIAEARGFTTLGLGVNIEEAGAYPDNEAEFINRFNAVLPFAVGAGRRCEVVAPVANLTKREIVELGLRLDAPMDLTWSCYEGGAEHCGRCGPCYMRKKAFDMAGRPDPVFGS